MNDQDQNNEDPELTPAATMPEDDSGEVLRPDVVALLASIAAAEPGRAADLLQSLIGNTGALDRVVTPAGSRAYRWSDHSTPLLDAAIAKAQGQIRNAALNRTNTHLGSSYADLASVWDACRIACSEAGVSVVQSIWPRKGHVVVTTRLSHQGQWVEADLPVQAETQKGVNSKQQLGIAITYGKRYALTSMLGIPAGEDTDGDDGSERGREEPMQNAQPNVMQRWRALVNQAGPMKITAKAMLDRVGKANPGELTNRDVATLASWLNENSSGS